VAPGKIKIKYSRKRKGKIEQKRERERIKKGMTGAPFPRAPW